MLLRKQVKAGILLYALLMSAIFTLILQFYLNRLVASQEHIIALEQQGKAYIMAQLTKDNATEDAGQLSFSEGHSSYRKVKDEVHVTVMLTDKVTYEYQFSNLQKIDQKKVDQPSGDNSFTKKDKSVVLDSGNSQDVTPKVNLEKQERVTNSELPIATEVIPRS